MPFPGVAKKHFINRLQTGEAVDDVFAIRSAQPGQARNGPFWSLVLCDATGEIDAKLWSPQAALFEDIPSGGFARVQATVGQYRDKPQLNIDGLTLLPGLPEGFGMGDFQAESDPPPEELFEIFQGLAESELRSKPWKKFFRRFLADPEMKSRLVSAPGAKHVHHAYRGGLLEHLLSVARVSLSMADCYPGVLDRDTLLAAALVHDLGKAWELTSGLDRDYTVEGRLLGHIQIGLEQLAPFLRKASDLPPETVMHFKHIILAHHGEYEYGSPKRPKSPEAFVLHFADNVDAKINQCLAAEVDVQEGAFGPYQRTLERALYHPVRPARERGEDKAAKDLKKRQCLLPLKA